MAEENNITAGAGTIPAATQGKFGSTKTQVREARDKLKSGTDSIAEEYRGKAEQIWGDACDRANTFQEDGKQYVRENPTKGVVMAFGIGFVLGITLGR